METVEDRRDSRVNRTESGETRQNLVALIYGVISWRCWPSTGRSTKGKAVAWTAGCAKSEAVRRSYGFSGGHDILIKLLESSIIWGKRVIDMAAAEPRCMTSPAASATAWSHHRHASDPSNRLRC